MKKQLHPRPNLEHLRRQAKLLLATLDAGDASAQTFIHHLPAAKGMTAPQVRAAGFRLADAQFAVARKEGFASWPKLAAHVDTLRSLEGTWDFAALEIDGAAMPAAAFGRSQLLIDGDRFCMRSPEADYEGVFTIDVEAEPHTIDIHFVVGPEAGNWSYGLFERDGDSLSFCLGLTGFARPTGFSTAPGSGHALERLVRSSTSRPADLAARAMAPGQGSTSPADGGETEADTASFEFVAQPIFEQLAGTWQAVELVRNGEALPKTMLAFVKRVGKCNETRVSAGGQVMVDARMRIDAAQLPVAVDYLHSSGTLKGKVQQGILEWIGDEVRFCMAAVGDERPTEFSSKPGSGRILSRWRRE